MPVSINNTQVVFNDGTTQNTAAVSANTTNVLNATAGASVGAVGTYAFLGEASTTSTAAGGTQSGSNLRYVGVGANAAWSNTVVGAGQFGGNGGTPAGTWRCMGRSLYIVGCFINFYPATLWLRIS